MPLWFRKVVGASLFPLALTVGASGCAALQSLDETGTAEGKTERETVDPHEFDTGQYGGVVLEDPDDRRNIQGFVYLSLAWGTHLEPAFPRAIASLGRAVNSYTRMRAKVMDHTFLSSTELFRRPFVYIATKDAFELTGEEVENLGRYMRNGGFVVADNGRPDLSYGPAEASLREMFAQALGREGKLVKISDRHPIYRSFFDLNGPPFGGDRVSFGGAQLDTLQRPPRVEHLEGIFLDGQLVAVYSDMGYGGFWEQSFENEPQLKMGVNLVVYALTRKGSMARPLQSLLQLPD